MEKEKLTLPQLESLRKKVVVITVICAVISVVAAIILMVLFSSSEYFEDGTVSFILSLFIGVFSFVFLYLIICLRPYKEFKKGFKRSIIEDALGEFFTDIDYDPVGCFTKDFIRDACMVRTGNRYSGDDLIKAKYKNIPFEQCDLLIQNHTSSGKSSHTVTYFKGKWFVFDFPKFRDLYLRISEKKGNAAKAGTTFGDVKAEKVLFENEQFNRDFEVKSSDRHMAFYIVTPVFMEDIQRINVRTDGQLIVGIKDGKLHVALHTGKNSMEPSLFKPINEESVQEIKKEVREITDFIDHLTQNKKLFGGGGEATAHLLPIQ